MKNVYVVIAFKKNNKGESYANKIVGVYSTYNKGQKAGLKQNDFFTITEIELDK